MKYVSTKFLLPMFLLLAVAITSLTAQTNLSFLRVSPQATTVQGVGFATITIDYSRPAVNGREIWGTLVPYGLAPNNFGNGKPMPWRAGANENTTITLSHDSEIEGNKLSAGKYALLMIVKEDEWTIILNNDTDGWGGFFYEEKNDVLRFKVKPTTASFKEQLEFSFDNVTQGSAIAFLHWGEVKVSFEIKFDQHAVVLDTYRKELTGLAGFNQAAWGAAARYCANNNINLEEAQIWIDKALGMNGGNTFNNNAVKASLLTIKGKDNEAKKLMSTALGTATEAEVNVYGYQLMNQGKIDEAIEIFELNVKNHPEVWNTYDSLAEALANKGDKKKAKEFYEKAYDMAPTTQQQRIEGIIKGL